MLFFSASEHYDLNRKSTRTIIVILPIKTQPHPKNPFISEEKRTMDNVYKCSLSCFSDIILELPFTLTHPMPDTPSTRTNSFRSSVADDPIIPRYTKHLHTLSRYFENVMSLHENHSLIKLDFFLLMCPI